RGSMQTNTLSRPRAARAARRWRRGVASVLAMLFMILFAILALGFMAMVGTATQVSHNDADTARSMLAAESAMQFTRYHLARGDLGSAAGEPARFQRLYDELVDRLAGTPNMAGNAPSLSSVAGQPVIHIPGVGGSAGAAVYNWMDFGPDIGSGR